MPGFKSHSRLVDAYDLGQTRMFSWRKVPSQTTAAGIWFDLSMSPGNPVANYYAAAPLTSKALTQADDGGIFHGAAVSPATKHLHRLTAIIAAPDTAVPLPMILCDYLMYYPFVDMSVTDPQEMIVGSVLGVPTTIPRYTDGVGVQIMAVEVAAQIGGSTFFVEYTNSATPPVSGRLTPTITCNTQISTGTIISSAPTMAGSVGPFLPLQQGDSGVTKIDKVTFLTGDIGLITLVLVKPLTTIAIMDKTGPAEKDLTLDGMVLPRIYDNAYLNFLCLPFGTIAAANILGTAEYVWN